MHNLTFLYEENGFTVSKLEVMGSRYYIVQHKAAGLRFIRRSLRAVDAIVRTKVLD